MKKDFITSDEISDKEYNNLIDKAIEIKKNPEKYHQILANKTLVMLFQKTSTRTRVSFEAGINELGGHAIFLDWKMTQLDRGALKDEARCLSRYCSLIMARVYKNETIKELAKYSDVPVINALCDLYHPCQAFSDMMTIKEKLGSLKGKTFAYIGDGNNVCNSLINATNKVGMKINIATPKGYEPLKQTVKKHKDIMLTNEPKKAIKGADVIYTDTWVSMGHESEAQRRIKIFKPFQVSKKLIGNSKALIMHCLPAHRGYEITDDVIDSKYSIIYDQAENRMHGEKAIMLWLLGKI